MASFPQLSAIPKAFGDSLARLFAGSSYIQSGLAITAHGAGSLQIDVAAGTAWVNGAFVNYAGGNVLPAGASATARIDLVRIASGAAVPTIIQGVPAAVGGAPVEPALPAGDLYLGQALILGLAADYTTGSFVADYTIPFTLGAGQAANPALVFSADLTTGIFRPGAGIWAVSTAGVERFRTSAAGTLVAGRLGVNGGTSATYGLDLSGGGGTYAMRIIAGAGDFGILMQVGSTAAQQLLALQTSAGLNRFIVDASGATSAVAGFTVSTNNVPFLSGKDSFGNNQTLAFLDNDKNMVWGPGDIRTQNIFQQPVHLFKPHWSDDFIGKTLGTWWNTYSTNGSGAMFGNANVFGGYELSSGAVANNDFHKLALDSGGVPGVTVGSGAIVTFIIQSEDALNQIMEWGLEADGTGGVTPTVYARFRCTEAGAATNWQAECSNGGAVTTVDTTVLRDATRRFYAIDATTAGVVKFYSDAGGVYTLRATINTNVPAGNLHPYVRIQSNAVTANKRLALDTVYLIRNR